MLRCHSRLQLVHDPYQAEHGVDQEEVPFNLEQALLRYAWILWRRHDTEETVRAQHSFLERPRLVGDHAGCLPPERVSLWHWRYHPQTKLVHRRLIYLVGGQHSGQSIKVRPIYRGSLRLLARHSRERSLPRRIHSFLQGNIFECELLRKHPDQCGAAPKHLGSYRTLNPVHPSNG